MALDRLTKVDGGGISTTSDYRVGIITASKFVGPFDGSGGNFSGVVTATNGVFSGNISAVDGNFSGNVTIGGTLTYEDVTNIDSVGLITARNGIDCNGDIDVDGHTNLDNVSIAGITTMSGNLSLESTYPRIYLKDTNHNPDFSILNNDGNLGFRDDTNGEYRLQILGTGETKVYHNLIVDKDLDVDGHTNLDNVSCSGILTAQNFDYKTASNIRIGQNAAPNVTMNRNIAIGDDTLKVVATHNNIAIGYAAGERSSTGSGGNVLIGRLAGNYLTTSSATFIGNASGRYQTGNTNTAVGSASLQGSSGASGQSNTALGFWSLRESTSSDENTAAGFRSLLNLTSSSDQNTGIGAYALHSITSGSSKNTSLGYRAGDALVTGSNNIIIGYGADASTTTTSNEITLGDANITHLRVPGIGVSFNNTGGTQLGIITATDLDISGDIDVDGHTNLDNVSIAGVTTFSTSPVVPNGTYYKGVINSGSQEKIVGGYISGSNTLRLGESMYLTMNPERLGLGINDPQRTLHLSSNNTVIALTDTAAGTNQKTKYILSDAGVFAVGKLSDDYNTATEHLYIDNNGLVIINRGGNGGTADVNADNFVVKNYDSSSSCGISILNADNQNSTLYFGNASDTKHAEVVWSDAANLFLIGTSNAGASIKFRVASQSDALTIDSNGHLLPGSAGAQNLGSTTLEWGDVYIADDKKLQIGSSQDLQIYHTNSGTSWIRHTNSSEYFILEGNQMDFRDYATGVYRARMGTAVQLYYNGNNVKLATTNTGITVTGEVAASQDYPDIGPTVDLNFAATESLDPRIDFYRASAASYIDQNGKLVLVPPNTPRFVYDQTTKKCKGLLIESSGRNRVSSSGTNDGSATAAGTVIGNAFTTNQVYHGIELPTGEIGTVRKLVSNSSGMRYGDYGGTANTSYTGSVWLRAVSGTANVYIDVNDTNTINPTLTEEWVRYTVTSATNNNYRFFDIYFANTQSVYMYGVQLEDSAYMTSYIPVYPNMSHGLRAPDYAVIDGQNFTDFYNPDESSVLAVGMPNRPASAQGQLNIVHIGDDNEDGHGIFREHGTKDVWYHIRNNNNTPSGGNLNPSGFGDWDAGEEARIAIAFKSGDQAISVNGGNQITATVTSNYPTANITKMWIGSHGTGSFFEGTISRIAYYPKKLTDSQLNTLTDS